MACDPSTIAFLLEQTAAAQSVTARKMFGEYALYRGDKLVALVCGDTLYLKPTAGGRTLLGDAAVEASPYSGAKPCLLVPGEAWDEAEHMAELIRVTAGELPVPKPKRRQPAMVKTAALQRRARPAPSTR